jgi:mannitol-1-/sugar-/sorbitol-6-phosphatase
VIAGLLLDLDGTLVDSRAPTEATWRAWAQRHGLDGEAVARSCHGVPSLQHVAAWAPHLDAAAESAAIEAEQVAADEPVRAFPGAAELLRASNAVAIVTSGTPELARRRLRDAGLTAPEVVVCAGDAPRGKPAPDPYLLGAQLLGVAIAACVVVEDAPAGIAAGVAAGARVMAVAHTHPCSELEAAERCFSDLYELMRALDA